MNVRARLEYELAYYDSAVHRFNHYTTRTPPEFLLVLSAGLRTCRLHIFFYTQPKWGTIGISLNWTVEYPFIVITSRSTVSRSGSTCWCCILFLGGICCILFCFLFLYFDHLLGQPSSSSLDLSSCPSDSVFLSAILWSPVRAVIVCCHLTLFKVFISWDDE